MHKHINHACVCWKNWYTYVHTQHILIFVVTQFSSCFFLCSNNNHKLQNYIWLWHQLFFSYNCVRQQNLCNVNKTKKNIQVWFLLLYVYVCMYKHFFLWLVFDRHLKHIYLHCFADAFNNEWNEEVKAFNSSFFLACSMCTNRSTHTHTGYTHTHTEPKKKYIIFHVFPCSCFISLLRDIFFADILLLSLMNIYIKKNENNTQIFIVNFNGLRVYK